MNETDSIHPDPEEYTPKNTNTLLIPSDGHYLLIEKGNPLMIGVCFNKEKDGWGYWAWSPQSNSKTWIDVPVPENKPDKVIRRKPNSEELDFIREHIRLVEEELIERGLEDTRVDWNATFSIS